LILNHHTHWVSPAPFPTARRRICSAAPSGQAQSRIRRRAGGAGLTAKARTERSSCHRNARRRRTLSERSIPDFTRSGDDITSRPACGLSSWRPDCVAEVVGLELRNVGANYPFERSHRFAAGIQPNSGHRDYSRLSCGVWETQLEPMPGSTSLGGAYSVGNLSRSGAASAA
jgi:hypothetical protein